MRLTATDEQRARLHAEQVNAPGGRWTFYLSGTLDVTPYFWRIDVTNLVIPDSMRELTWRLERDYAQLTPGDVQFKVMDKQFDFQGIDHTFESIVRTVPGPVNLEIWYQAHPLESAPCVMMFLGRIGHDGITRGRNDAGAIKEVYAQSILASFGRVPLNEVFGIKSPAGWLTGPVTLRTVADWMDMAYVMNLESYQALAISTKDGRLMASSRTEGSGLLNGDGEIMVYAEDVNYWYAYRWNLRSLTAWPNHTVVTVKIEKQSLEMTRVGTLREHALAGTTEGKFIPAGTDYTIFVAGSQGPPWMASLWAARLDKVLVFDNAGAKAGEWRPTAHVWDDGTYHWQPLLVCDFDPVTNELVVVLRPFETSGGVAVQETKYRVARIARANLIMDWGYSQVGAVVGTGAVIGGGTLQVYNEPSQWRIFTFVITPTLASYDVHLHQWARAPTTEWLYTNWLLLPPSGETDPYQMMWPRRSAAVGKYLYFEPMSLWAGNMGQLPVRPFYTPGTFDIETAGLTTLLTATPGSNAFQNIRAGAKIYNEDKDEWMKVLSVDSSTQITLWNAVDWSETDEWGYTNRGGYRWRVNAVDWLVEYPTPATYPAYLGRAYVGRRQSIDQEIYAIRDEKESDVQVAPEYNLVRLRGGYGQNLMTTESFDVVLRADEDDNELGMFSRFSYDVLVAACARDALATQAKTTFVADRFPPTVDMNKIDQGWSCREFIAWLCEATGHIITFPGAYNVVPGLTTRTSFGFRVRPRHVRPPELLVGDNAVTDDDLQVTPRSPIRVTVKSGSTTASFPESTDEQSDALSISNDGIPETLVEDFVYWLWSLFAAYDRSVSCVAPGFYWPEVADSADMPLGYDYVQGVVTEASMSATGRMRLKVEGRNAIDMRIPQEKGP